MAIDKVSSSSATMPVSQENAAHDITAKRKNPFANDELYSMNETFDPKKPRPATHHHIMRRMIDHAARLTPTICNLQQLDRKMAAQELARYRTLTENKVWLNNLEGYFEIGGGLTGASLAWLGYDSGPKIASALSNYAVRFTESYKIRANDDSQTILSVNLSAAKDNERHLGDHLTRLLDQIAKMQAYHAEARVRA